MCQICALKARNTRPRKVSKGFIRSLIVREMSGHGIFGKYPCFPLFNERAANFAIEAGVYYWTRRKTNKKVYRRHGRTHQDE